MTCKILSRERWQRLLDNKLDHAERKEVLDHLRKADCEACEEFISNMDAADEQRLMLLFNAGRKTDASKSSSVAGVSVHGDKSSPSEALRAKPAVTPVKTSIWSWGPMTNTWMGGFATAVVLMVIIVPQLYISSPDRVIQTHKKDSRVTTSLADINLKFAVGNRVGEELVVTPGRSGDEYPGTGTVFLHYQIPAEGYVYIIGQSSGQAPELLYPESSGQQDQLRRPGEHTVRFDKRIAGLPLTGVQGRYIITGIYSVMPLDFKTGLLPLLGKIDIQKIHAGDNESQILRDGVVADAVFFDVRS